MDGHVQINVKVLIAEKDSVLTMDRFCFSDTDASATVDGHKSFPRSQVYPASSLTVRIVLCPVDCI
jgi:hypothetical protein